MQFRKFLVLALALLLPAQALAADRHVIGHGRLFSNDFLGDGQDRWQTGSYVFSQLQGEPERDGRPLRFGELLEYRLRFGIIAPSNLVSPDSNDRRYAGIISFGVHSHFDWNGLEISMGTDLVVVGPQTGIARFQAKIHDFLGQPHGDYSNQVGNQIYPTVLVEIGREYDLGESVQVRPFVEFQAGVETLLRVGADVTFGECRGGVLLRDVTTGQRYVGRKCQTGPRIAFTLGADTAKVFDSAFLQSSDGYWLTDTRSRIRAGIRSRVGGGSVFYGVTWLGREFSGQSEGQIVGSINVDLTF